MFENQTTATARPAITDIGESAYVAQVLEIFDDYPYLVAAVVENQTGQHPGFGRKANAEAARADYATPGVTLYAHIVTNEKREPRDFRLDDEAARQEHVTR